MKAMKVKKIAKHGAAYAAVKFIYDESPSRSWQRLNGALHDALTAAIVGHLSFQEDDFRAVRKDTNGGYWMGNGNGSALGERYYNLAVKVGHTPACISFEKYAGRPAALWPETVKTPERLCVGSEFTWEGLIVTVTSMKSDHLIACTYKSNPDAVEYQTLTEGRVTHADGHYRRVEELKRLDDGVLLIRLGPSLDTEHAHRIPDRRFKITYEQLAARRKEYDKVKKQALKEIEAADTPELLTQVGERLSAAGRAAYRHFDIEDLRSGIDKRYKAFSAQQQAAERERREAVELQSRSERMERWLAGEDGVGYWGPGPVQLRVRGHYIETSTGQSVTVGAVKALLPWALKRRNKLGPVTTGERIDLHPVTRFSATGVTVGCTLVPWTEIERLPSLLETLSDTSWLKPGA